MIENAIIYAFLFTSLYFEVFMLVTFFERAARRAVHEGLSRHPSVTVIIPCRNEAETIAGTIESVLALRYPMESLSLMVVDDGSTDATHRIAQTYERYPNVKVFSKEGGGKHTALNFGIERATTEFIAGLDADSFVHPEALHEMMYRFEQEPDIMAMTPAMKVRNPRTIIEQVQRAEYSLSIFYRAMFGRLGSLFVTPGPFSIYRKEVFERIGLFRPAYNTEDMEMALRMQKHHMRIENVPSAHVETTVPGTLPKLVRQRVRWTQGFLQNGVDYRHLFFSLKHGNLSLFILPLAVISFFGAIYFAGYLAYHAVTIVVDKYVQVSAVGLAGSFRGSYDWFFLNTTAKLFIVVGLIALTTTLIVLGKRFANERPFSRDILYYIAFYGFIAPLWLVKATYNAALAKQSIWK